MRARWRTTRTARDVIRNADTRGTAGLEDCLAHAGLDPGRFVLVDVAAWLWLADWAEDPKSVRE